MKPTTTAEYIARFIYPAAMALLPERMHSPEAKAMLLAIGFQESGFSYRKQLSGPARGFWEFEEDGGVHGVLVHRATKPIIDPILPVLAVPAWGVYDALSNHDVLACVFARLLLWTHPDPLPASNNPAGAWHYYVETWRPGKPRREVWDWNFERAWKEVTT